MGHYLAVIRIDSEDSNHAQSWVVYDCLIPTGGRCLAPMKYCPRIVDRNEEILQGPPPANHRASESMVVNHAIFAPTLSIFESFSEKI